MREFYCTFCNRNHPIDLRAEKDRHPGRGICHQGITQRTANRRGKRQPVKAAA